MKCLGLHIILDAWDASKELLDDPKIIKKALEEATRIGKATLIDVFVHKFSPHGATGVAVLSESHIAIHTWPEYGYFGADIFFCGKGDPYKAAKVLQMEFQAKKMKVKEIKRGLPTSNNLSLLGHTSEGLCKTAHANACSRRNS